MGFSLLEWLGDLFQECIREDLGLSGVSHSLVRFLLILKFSTYFWFMLESSKHLLITGGSIPT